MKRPTVNTRGGFCIGAALFFTLCFTHGVFAVPVLTFDLKVPDRQEDPRRIVGRVVYEGVVPNESETCFYVPYNDPEYGLDRKSTKLEFMTTNASKVRFLGGSTEVARTDGGLLRWLSPHLFVIYGRQDLLELSIDSVVPALPQPDKDAWFFEGFYPKPLASCPPESLRSIHYRPVSVFSLKGTLQSPTGWQLIHADSGPDQQKFSYEAREYTFALLRNFKSRRLDHPSIPIFLHYRDDELLDLADSVLVTLREMQDWLGEYPYPALHIFESEDVQKFGVPGIIGFNTPRQALFKRLQRSYLNWREWILTNFLVSQWFGAAIMEESLDDQWLIYGLLDHAALEMLRRNPTRYNLINPLSNGFQLVSFTYEQAQDISGSVLQNFSPFSLLTNEDFKTAQPYDLQEPLLFVRHSLAVRHLKSVLGERLFDDFMRRLYNEFRFERLSPEQFFETIAADPGIGKDPKKRSEAVRVVRRWWTSKDWPDYALDDWDVNQTAKDQWLTKVVVEDHGEFNARVPIRLTGDKGQTRDVWLESTEAAGRRSIDVMTDFEPEAVEIDPGRQIFDANRFNNSSRLPAIGFFPGSAKTLADDAYTIVWAPYFFRRPGEAFALGLSGALFRYIHSGLIFTAEGAPSTKRGAYEIRQKYRIAPWATGGEFVLEQTFENVRTAEASLTRAPLLPGFLHTSLDLKLRYNSIVGRPDTDHPSVLVGGTLRPAGRIHYCGYNLSGAQEVAPRDWNNRFSYRRSTGSAAGSCSVFGYADAAIRLFRGSVARSELAPETTGFRPNEAGEGRMRLDIGELTFAEEIYTITSDLLFPLVLPLPHDTLVLSRQMRLRFFYDFGRALDTDTEFRAGGTGLLIPFGGDLSGTGSLAITSLSLAAVLYNKAGSEIRRKPGILIDFKGEF